MQVVLVLLLKYHRGFAATNAPRLGAKKRSLKY